MITIFRKTLLSQRLYIKQMCAFMFIICSCAKEKTNITELSEEVNQIREPILELYKNLKVENNSIPNFDYIISLFTATANLGFVKEDSLILKSPKNYFSGMQGGIDGGMIKLIHEWEIKGKTEYFGDIAHHISTYGVYFGTTDAISERGITSFQLVKLKGDWKIQSMIWKAENEDLKIPIKYLEK
jgi:hypothetical protein